MSKTDKVLEEYTAKEAANNPFKYDCWFRLQRLEEELEESDIDIYNDMLEKIEKGYDDRLDHIEGFRYTISNLADNEIDLLIDIFEDAEEKLDSSYINYDFDEVDDEIA